MTVRLTILGQPASKGNRRMHVKFGDRSASIKSPEARAYEKSALLQIPQRARVMLTGPVRVTMTIYYSSERSDLDESVVLDVMQARYTGKGSQRELSIPGVYLNDRQVREKHVFHGIDRANPRAEIEVEEIVAGLFEELPRTIEDLVKPRRRDLVDPQPREGALIDPF